MHNDQARKRELQPKFPLGRMQATPNALSKIPNEEILSALSRHIKGDWGIVDNHDRAANERALAQGERLFSVYYSSRNVRFWIITEADRSLTTVLLPEDY